MYSKYISSGNLNRSCKFLTAIMPGSFCFIHPMYHTNPFICQKRLQHPSIYDVSSLCTQVQYNMKGSCSLTEHLPFFQITTCTSMYRFYVFVLTFFLKI